MGDTAGVYNTEAAGLADFENPLPDTLNVSRGIGGALGGEVYLPPGDTAAFRIRWTWPTGVGPFNFAQSQIDNLAIEGTFFETAALVNAIDPVTAGEENIPVLPVVFQWLFFAALFVIGMRRFKKKLH